MGPPYQVDSDMAQRYSRFWGSYKKAGLRNNISTLGSGLREFGYLFNDSHSSVFKTDV
jgi:hypothetical protein